MVTPLLAVSLTAGQWMLLIFVSWILCVVVYAWIEVEQTPAQREFRAEQRTRAALAGNASWTTTNGAKLGRP